MKEKRMAENNEPKKLYRSKTNRTVAGVCGGLADYFNADASVVRLLWVVLTVLTGVGPGIVAYLIAALVIPEAPAQ
jgi:phage shock protein PspC (stress-responsive transcriptional regulator)